MITVIADDLSGAAELAGLALHHGLRAEVQTAFSADTDADVICVDTDTRALPAPDAARVAGAVAQQVLAARPEWIFKKCDSVLRGPVLAEARAIAHVAGLTRIVVLSANPSRGRIIRGGEYFVAGVPLHETVFARDPAHPRTTSRVAELLSESDQPVGAQSCYAQVVRPPEGRSKSAPLHEAPDAETDADVARIAASVDGSTLPVGAADFFTALLAMRADQGSRWNATSRRVQETASAPGTSRSTTQPTAIPHSALRTPHSPTLLVCGSAASWPQRRADAEKSGIPVFGRPHDPTAIARALRVGDRAVVSIGDGPATRGQSPAELTVSLAAVVAAVLREAAPARLLLEGGATARAVIAALGWTRLRACEAVAPGIGAVRPAGADAPLLLIKPGSYAWPDGVWP